ncbi:MAG: MBL fold metallo-hydrolase [Candidatus Campbellbacteria bacterium]|nr:MBL fold metallo-hydrolase [Candidatus Campbellbacteria bacterium]
MNEKNSKLKFYGGAGAVTGANFMLKTDEKKILIDCGMVQGSEEEEEKNWADFEYDPKDVDVVFITHAHADHIGRIPKLVRDGFKGVIYSTDATRELASVMFEDSLSIARFEEKKTGREHYYDHRDVDRALDLWKTIDYHSETEIGGGFSVYFRDAGHILGSAIIEITRNGRKIAFTGDLGNSPTPLLRPTEFVTDANYLLMESVYGDRDHENVAERTEKLKAMILDTHDRGGALVMPTFSIERTQVMLYELNELIESGEVPTMPVFLDSPLAIEVTEIYKKYQQYFNKDIKRDIREGDNIFNFPGFQLSNTREDSRRINNEPNPKIVMAGSGMSEGGRILYHYQQYISDPSSTILLVGYQPVGGLGHALLNGEKEITLFGEKIQVNAKIESILSYSAHMQSSDLQEFAERAAEKGDLERVFVAMGEPKSSLFLVQRLRDHFGIDAVAPEEGEEIEIDF